MRPVRTGVGLLVLLCTSLGPVEAQRRVSPLAQVLLALDSLTWIGGHLVYGYRLVNGQDSKGGVAAFTLDLSAPTGTGFLTLPSTGRFVHGAGVHGAKGLHDHVPVGPISPTNWEAFLLANGWLDWYGARGGLSGQYDSIAPHDSLAGFGVRSPFLPGIRQFSARPTFASCCTTLRPPNQSSEPEYPNPSEFRVTGWTVGPTIPPEKMTVRVLAALLDRVCGKLGWISSMGACQALRVKLTSASQRVQLSAFLAELEAQHGPGKDVNDNAYWLLKVNGEYVLAHM